MNNQDGNANVEVVEEVVEVTNPLRIRVVFNEGTPIEFTLDGLTPDHFQAFIETRLKMAENGFFLGNMFIPRSNVKFFESVL